MEWQPIDTVPLSDIYSDNLHVVLLWCPTAGEGGRGATVFGWASKRSDGAIRVQGDSMHGDWRFTHWMPLPEPPR